MGKWYNLKKAKLNSFYGTLNSENKDGAIEVEKICSGQRTKDNLNQPVVKIKTSALNSFNEIEHILMVKGYFSLFSVSLDLQPANV